MKPCKDCNDRPRDPGRGSYCIPCHNVRTRANYHARAGQPLDRPCNTCGVAPRRWGSYCTECHKVRTRSKYHANLEASREAGRAWYDKHKVRRAAEARAHRAADPTFEMTRRARRYGLTREGFLAMYEAQGGRCAICGDARASQGRNGLHVDHCHATGRVRGLLCGSCNAGLGRFRDSPVRLQGAIAYLGI